MIYTHFRLKEQEELFNSQKKDYEREINHLRMLVRVKEDLLQNISRDKRWVEGGEVITFAVFLMYDDFIMLFTWWLTVWPCINLINPFPHIDTFWRLCSRQLFENIVTKEEIAQNEQFLPQCFPLLVIGYPFNYRDFLFFDKICSKSSVAELSYEGKG